MNTPCTSSYSWRSASVEETEALGMCFGRCVSAGAIVALDGDLGAGKTAWVRGLAAGLSAPERVQSPTFTIESIYRGRLNLHHFDAYFAAKADSYLDAGGEDAFYAGGVAVIEWAEQIERFLPLEHLKIHIQHRGPELRELNCEARGPLAQRWLAATVAEWQAALAAGAKVPAAIP